MKARHVPGIAQIMGISDDAEYSAAYAKLERGDFDVETATNGQRLFWFVCPGPCKSLAPLHLRPLVGAATQSWVFDGNMAAPTLNPSINHVGCWHGWLRAGEFVV